MTCQYLITPVQLAAYLLHLELNEWENITFLTETRISNVSPGDRQQDIAEKETKLIHFGFTAYSESHCVGLTSRIQTKKNQTSLIISENRASQ